MSSSPQHYNVIVVGGGSGGLAASKECAKHGLTVALFDLPTPSAQGNSYTGLGGTCVNAGCIPKKFIHEAVIAGESAEDSKTYGWTVSKESKIDWDTLVDTVQNNIRGTNWVYRVELRSKNVEVHQEFASLVDNKTLKGVAKNGKEQLYTFDHLILSPGHRPDSVKIPGAELAVTSDDIFFLEKAPGKTLCVGASYISLETAGWIHGLGFDATVMMRSIPLRGSDQQMAEFVVEYMEKHGVKFHKGFVPTRMEKVEGEHNIRVYFKPTAGGEEQFEDFDTVMFAIGRTPNPTALGLQNTNVKLDAKGRVLVDDHDRTAVDNIYCIGDMASGRMELTPVAILSGRLLARRIAGVDDTLMHYEAIPTTVFTPLEYGYVGLSEEKAIAQYGEDDVDCFMMKYKPYCWVIPARGQCLAKVVIQKSTDKVVGMHICAPQAGEIIQGYAPAIRMGITKKDLDLTVQLHPTTSERLINLEVSKSSGASFESATCCG